MLPMFQPSTEPLEQPSPPPQMTGAPQLLSPQQLQLLQYLQQNQVGVSDQSKGDNYKLAEK